MRSGGAFSHCARPAAVIACQIMVSQTSRHSTPAAATAQAECHQGGCARVACSVACCHNVFEGFFPSLRVTWRGLVQSTTSTGHLRSLPCCCEASLRSACSAAGCASQILQGHPRLLVVTASGCQIGARRRTCHAHIQPLHPYQIGAWRTTCQAHTRPLQCKHSKAQTL